MTTTLSSYLTIARNFARYQKMVAAEPATKTASDYYAANIGKVKSVGDFVSDYRLLSYALKSYGLSDHISDKALITKVLQGGVDSAKALANKLSDPRWRAFARAFDFIGKGAASVSTDLSISATKNGYVENKLEVEQGESNAGVQLALYFIRVAPTASSAYSIIGDKNLLQVVQTIFRLPAISGSTDIDQQAKIISKLMPIDNLKDPAKLEKLTERFAAMCDLTYGPGSGGSGLSAVGYGPPQTSAAVGILQGVIQANGETLSKVLSTGAPKPIISDQLMTQLQRLSTAGL